MKFQALSIPGACRIEIDPRGDDRGFFARIWCREEFAAHGVAIGIEQASLSYNRHAGTLRGMHYARAPALEGKLVRCQRGQVHDVIVDLRPESPAYMQHVALELCADNHTAIWVPPSVAHGFLTLEDDTEVVYMMSEAYHPELAAGVRHDDPAFGIRWPRPVRVIADRDRAYGDFVPDPSR